ncbi:glycosyltransferase [Cognatilysobacter bugurensis]|uniref:Colanic acid biosynthesis glycosyltransferase WcaL n=1 Tax=Cognatilysobacter bugurensis TaxID=543356 RepID=A0A918SW90_9GAMM|nr:glycosyltransferase [Lysobacter bugurensis]GHA74669.1 colanic acid biosynthesis glycosyltransferase WcaL [Lysobacter bugurensis]
MNAQLKPSLDSTPSSQPPSGVPRVAPAAPRRVLYIVSAFPAWSETFIVREVRTLIDDGVDVRILSLKDRSDGLVQTDAAAMLDRVHWPQPAMQATRRVLGEVLARPGRILGAAARIVAGTWREPVSMLKSLVAFGRGLEHLHWLRSFDPELIHAHWATYPSTVAWALGRVLDRPFGFTSHAHDIFLHRHLLRTKLEDSALAITISQHNVEWFQRHVSSEANRKLRVVHCGVDLDMLDWKPGGRSDDLIVATGRLHPIKGFDTLIRALALLDQRGAAFRCRIIGDGPLRDELETLIRSLGLEKRVELAGAQPQEVVRASLDEAAVFALPSQVSDDGGRDGIPVALMEAMASGCPVVSCLTSGIPELIENGEGGLLVRERDPAALADALQRLLSDRALRERFSRAARDRVEQQFDARTEARKLHRLMMKAAADVA